MGGGFCSGERGIPMGVMLSLGRFPSARHGVYTPAENDAATVRWAVIPLILVRHIALVAAGDVGTEMLRAHLNNFAASVGIVEPSYIKPSRGDEKGSPRGLTEGTPMARSRLVDSFDSWPTYAFSSRCRTGIARTSATVRSNTAASMGFARIRSTPSSFATGR